VTFTLSRARLAYLGRDESGADAEILAESRPGRCADVEGRCYCIDRTMIESDAKVKKAAFTIHLRSVDERIHCVKYAVPCVCGSIEVMVRSDFAGDAIAITRSSAYFRNSTTQQHARPMQMSDFAREFSDTRPKRRHKHAYIGWKVKIQK
jgi:hypothetical protein